MKQLVKSLARIGVGSVASFCQTLALARADEMAHGRSGSAERRQLAAARASNRAASEELSACKRLAVMGNADSVAAVAPLLSGAELAHAARIGLKASLDPVGREALRAGLNRVQGDRLVGVINAIGVRHDRQAVAGLGATAGRR